MNPSTGRGLVGTALQLPEYAVPDRPWRGLRRQRHWQIDGLPALQALELELNVFRALLRARARTPARHLLLSRHYTLTKNRWLASERVAKAALRDGHPSETVVELLADTLAEFAPPDFEYTPECATRVVQSVLNAPRQWVIHPGRNGWLRIIGSVA